MDSLRVPRVRTSPIALGVPAAAQHVRRSIRTFVGRADGFTVADFTLLE